MNNKDLGIVQIELSNNESSNNLIDLAKNYHDHNPYNHVCLFNSFCEIIETKNVPILHISQAKFFRGNLLITDIQSLELCISFPNLNKIVFFASDIPWIEQQKNYKDWENLFYHNRLEIIAKNRDIYDIYSICYKSPRIISERLSYEKIEECL